MPQLEFENGTASVETLTQLTDRVWTELRSPEGKEAVQAAGFDPALLTGPSPFNISRDASGVEPTMTAILVGLGVAVGKDVLLDLWRSLILPRIKEAAGGEAVGKEHKGKDGHSKK
jgi:hypothetical protein